MHVPCICKSHDKQAKGVASTGYETSPHDIPAEHITNRCDILLQGSGTHEQMWFFKQQTWIRTYFLVARTMHRVLSTTVTEGGRLVLTIKAVSGGCVP
jgi:hypothetical protein